MHWVQAMNITPRHRLIRFAASLLVFGAGICSWSDLLAQSNTAPPSGAERTTQDMLAGVTARAPDAFYDPPAQVPSRPGALLRSESLKDVTLPAGMQGWRILYTTTVNDSTSATAVATVFAPVNPPAGPRPVITWKHGTTGVLQKFMPSLVSAPTTGIPALDRIVAAGWVIVATDYSFAQKGGPHPYIISEGEARAALDAVRAARQMPELTLDARTVVWGHSQGGHAALWTGQLADSYAPDVQVAGLAAIAPAADLTGLASHLDEVPVGSIFASYIMQAYSEVYDDVRFGDYIRAAASIPVREIAGRCLDQPEVFVSVLTTLFFDRSIFQKAPETGPAGERLAENVPLDPIPAPVFVAQGEGDPLVLPSVQQDYVDRRCALGDTLAYRTYPGYGHVDVVGTDSPLIPDLVQWTQDRIDGKPATSTC
jgi:acetyl esterase/lipase